MNWKSFLLIIFAILVGYYIKQTLYFVPPIPDLPLDQYWGPGNDLRSSDTSIKKFKISFDTEVLFQAKYDKTLFRSCKHFYFR